ncbi:1275_t:CDS:1 [Ambispora leptoticha]|uniref:1275_t:CDS:1 n=1 Tax=Ambispora leptoticha TaxID=144679 RepID=A0A9N9EHN5_9GLOM|nr:1275_t:CDS:1 [Ambispora leptoticha]
MAATLPLLCIEAIIENLSNNNEQQQPRRFQQSHFKLLLINRHWCQSIMPKLWIKPFDDCSARNEPKLFQTVVNCLDEETKLLLAPEFLNKSPPTFQYLYFIKYLNIITLIEVAIRSRMQRNKIELAYAIYRKLLSNDVGHTLNKLNINFATASRSHIRWDTVSKFSNKNFVRDWDPFRLTNGRKSLANLFSLTLSEEYSNRFLPVAAKACPNVSEIFIEIFPGESTFMQPTSLQRIYKMFSLLDLFPKLSSFCLFHVRRRRVSYKSSKFLEELGDHLPSKKYHHFILDINLEFSGESLDTFFQKTTATFQTFAIPAVDYISDQCLDVFIKYAESHKIKELDIGKARLTSKEALEEAKKVIPKIHRNPAYVLDFIIVEDDIWDEIFSMF